jgi:hypothetical protein
MKVTLEDALSVLGKYVEERKPVLAVFLTPSMSVARVTGTIRISMVDGVTAYLIAGKGRPFEALWPDFFSYPRKSLSSGPDGGVVTVRTS